ncbi:putative Ig domain-containing protein [Streptacidiphilus cavernicola]|uniref:Ig domain-containing protein n=1 Tax=Streptacidiphilus cavernicola TaxID=3342716 RepID=A0ABV6VWD2_9ACTN
MIRTGTATRPRRAALGTVATLAALGALVAAGHPALARTTTAAVAAPAVAPAAPAATAQHRVLFDNTKAETAGNADWVISTSQPDPLAQNPNPTSESSWTGALSAWGVALQKTGDYSLKTLPSGNTITYGTSNALDLSNFDTFVIDEPNIRLSTAEKTAVMTFVQHGGGLFLISDHNGSDRNNDGWDSPAIINDLMTSNGVDNTDPFGFSVDLKDISKDDPRAITDATDPVLHGPFGTVTGSILADGTTFTLKPADNPSVKGLLYLTTGATGGNTNAFFVTSTFGAGRVAIWGDSSPVDDGTGSSGNTLYNGWDDPGGTDAALALNATNWLSTGSGGTGGGGAVTVTNPGTRTATVGTATSLQLAAGDTAGGTVSWTASGLPAGLSVNPATGLVSGTPTTAGSSSVTVTATDSTGPAGSATFTWTVTAAGGGGCTAGQLLANPGFETGTAAPWTETHPSGGSLVSHTTAEPARTGSYDAWLDGYGTTTTDTLAQTVAIPSGCATDTFSFWLHINTAETGSTAYDTLKVQVLNSAGTVLSTLATYSNTNAAGGYLQHSFSLAGYAGQTVTLKFTGAEDYTKQTSFVLDDTSLNVG